MTNLGSRPSSVIIIGPTESVLTKRGNRHPSLALNLVEHGKSVTYISANFSHATKSFFSREEIKRAAKVVPYRLLIFRTIGYSQNISSRRVVNNFLFSARVFLWLLFRVRKSDTIILPSRPVELIFFVGFLRKIRKCQVLLDIQDVWPDALQIKDERKKRLFRSYCDFYLRPSLKWIDSFVHVAPSFDNWLKRYSPEAKSVFVPLGYDAIRWEELASSGREELNRPVDLVCVGMLQYQIDVMPVLDALIGRPEFRLTIIGEDGCGDRYEEVSKFIKKNGLDNVSIVGRVAPEEMPAYLMRMDIGIVPMITNSIPNKVFDYIGARLPILVLGENDSGCLVQSEEIGWTVPYGKQGVVSFFEELNSSDYRRKRKRLLERRGEFDRQRLFSIILGLIES